MRFQVAVIIALATWTVAAITPILQRYSFVLLSDTFGTYNGTVLFRPSPNYGGVFSGIVEVESRSVATIELAESTFKVYIGESDRPFLFAPLPLVKRGDDWFFGTTTSDYIGEGKSKGQLYLSSRSQTELQVHLVDGFYGNQTVLHAYSPSEAGGQSSPSWMTPWMIVPVVVAGLVRLWNGVLSRRRKLKTG